MKKNVFLFLLLMLPLLANAVEVEIDGLWYRLKPKGKTAEVIQYKKGARYSGDVVIPSTVTYEDVKYSVTRIGGNAFDWCTDLNSITIGDNVTTIGNDAFRNCKGLTSVTFPPSVTIVGSHAFFNCNLLAAVHISDLGAWNRISFFDWSSDPLTYARHLYLNGEELKN